jgi:hypothetical protein
MEQRTHQETHKNSPTGLRDTNNTGQRTCGVVGSLAPGQFILRLIDDFVVRAFSLLPAAIRIRIVKGTVYLKLWIANRGNA